MSGPQLQRRAVRGTDTGSRARHDEGAAGDLTNLTNLRVRREGDRRVHVDKFGQGLAAAGTRMKQCAATHVCRMTHGIVLQRAALPSYTNNTDYSPGCQLSAGTNDFVTIWDLLVISASASADPYIFRVIINSYQCPAQCLLNF